MGKSAGKIMPLPRGAYDENATYNILDMVTLDNKLWIAKKSGITGIEPSKTAPEWMMAVDGTTDVKGLETEVDAKFASIDEQFLAKDTQISGLNGRVTAAEGSITSLGGRCDEIEGKFAFDETPTEGSMNLITSGTAYAMLNKLDRHDGSSNGDYEIQKGWHSTGAGGASIRQNTEQRSTQSDGLLHRDMGSSVSAGDASASIRSSIRLKSDHTSASYYEESSSGLTVTSSRISMEFRTNNEYRINKNKYIYLNYTCDAMCTQDDAQYDIGTSDCRFKNIYASTGVIQTSDETEKKNIERLDATVARNIIMGLNPVTYKFIDGTSDRTHYGLIAQDVEKTVNGLGIDNKDFAGIIKTQKHVTDEDGKETPIEGEYRYGLRYDEFVGILIKMCQNLQNEVDDLKTEVAALKAN